MKQFRYIYILCFAFFLQTCNEPFNIQSIEFKDALVVEATLTNEVKTQIVKLSRTINLEADGTNPEQGAMVSITDEANNTFTFQETSSGTYESVSPFAALENSSYTLSVVTSNGRTYSSTPERITGNSTFGDINAIKETNEVGVKGVSIKVNSTDPENKAKHYRYEYEETFQIIAPFWTPWKGEIISDVPPFEVELKLRTQEERVCYKTIPSNSIIQTETIGLSENSVQNFEVRFLTQSDFLTPHRYSILIKQLVQSEEAYAYYNTLQKFSSVDDPFSQNQPGTLVGNITSNNDADELVIGYFEVTSVTEKRIFLEHDDFFDERFDAFDDCETDSPPLTDPLNSSNSPLINGVKLNKFVIINEEILPSRFIVIPRRCTDCTALGSNIKPSFWVD